MRQSPQSPVVWWFRAVSHLPFARTRGHQFKPLIETMCIDDLFLGGESLCTQSELIMHDMGRVKSVSWQSEKLKDRPNEWLHFVDHAFVFTCVLGKELRRRCVESPAAMV